MARCLCNDRNGPRQLEEFDGIPACQVGKRAEDALPPEEVLVKRWNLSRVDATADHDPARGFVLSAGSITFGGSLVVDPILQRAVRNGIESALEPQVHELFRRGDSNGDGRVDLSDTIATLGILFFGGENRGCKDAQDANDGRAVYISTPSLTLGVLFFGNGVIPAPRVSSRGLDPTMDDYNCEAYQGCS